MSTDLSEQSLTECLQKIRDYLRDDHITLEPTKIIIPRYPGETDDEYLAKVEKARRLIEGAKS